MRITNATLSPFLVCARQTKSSAAPSSSFALIRKIRDGGYLKIYDAFEFSTLAMSGTVGFGFGIAGHKNSFSTSVRLGNWVEDEYGKMLSIDPTRGLKDGLPLSEAQSAFIDPRAMHDRTKCANHVESQLLTAAHEDLPSELIFGHTTPGGQRTTPHPKSLKIGCETQLTDKMRARVEALAQEDEEIRSRRSEARASAQYVSTPARDMLDIAGAEPLPVFTKRKLKCRNGIIHI